jgi:hypothetical protein
MICSATLLCILREVDLNVECELRVLSRTLTELPGMDSTQLNYIRYSAPVAQGGALFPTHLAFISVRPAFLRENPLRRLNKARMESRVQEQRKDVR